MAATGPRLVSPEDGEIPALPGLLQRPDGDADIEYSAELLQQIRAETVDAFLRLPHGGLEIAGVLFGTKLGRTLHLSACRAIDCEHAAGPALTLSDRDERELARLLAEASHDPALEGLEPLGWYVSHTRMAFALADSDAAVFDRFFSQPRHLTAVVRPEATGIAQVRVFARNEEGSVDPQQPSTEFTVHPEPGKLRPQSANVPALSDSEREQSLAKFRNEHWIAPFEPVSQKIEARKEIRQVRLSNFSLIAAGLVMLLVVAGASLWWFASQPQSRGPLPLRVTQVGQQLRIEWDASAQVVQRATSGILEIKDLGDNPTPVRLNLGPGILRTGSVLYSKPSDKVSIHLQLVDEDKHVAESMVYFLAREPAPAKVESTTPPDQTTAAAIPPVTERRDVIEKPESRSPATEDNRKARATPLKVFSTPPVHAAKPPVAEPSTIEAPKIPITQAQPVAPLVSSLHSEVSAPPPAIAASPKTETPKAPAAPTSGRLIWTGELHKGAVLKVTNRGASTGALNGTLPGGPIKVSVHTGELLDGAIAIYTSDQNARQSAEAPSRRNGWNVTMYKWDPKRAHDVVVVETPGQANDWKQLALKSVNRTTSIIVIDWQVTGN